LLAQAAHGGGITVGCLEQLVTLSGATTTSTAQIPNGAIVLAVSNRVVAAITGATSYSCGVAGNATQFGASLAVSAGSANLGLIGPNPFTRIPPSFYTAAGEVSPRNSAHDDPLSAAERRDGVARFPLGWNHPSDKKSRKPKMLEQVPIAKVRQLSRKLL